MLVYGVLYKLDNRRRQRVPCRDSDLTGQNENHFHFIFSLFLETTFFSSLIERPATGEGNQRMRMRREIPGEGEPV